MQFEHYSESSPPYEGSGMASLPFSVADLSYRMSQYSLQQPANYPSLQTDRQTCHSFPYGYASELSSPTSAPPSPASPEDSSLSTPMTSFPVSSSSSRLGSGYHSTNVRQQRQRALRRQTSASHLREISALVSRMVNEGEQCSVSATGAGQIASGRSRQNSDTRSDDSSGPLSDYGAEDEGAQSMEEDFSEPESINDTCEGFKIQESTGLVEWHCPWPSRARSDGKRSVKKDTSARKHTRRRAQVFV